LRGHVKKKIAFYLEKKKKNLVRRTGRFPTG
jgi:hypothetical protein